MEEIIEQNIMNETSVNNNHFHFYTIDEQGNGETIKTISIGDYKGTHIHKIINFKVIKNENHIHLLNQDIKLEEKQYKEEGKIKEINFILNISDTNYFTYTTEKIRGELLGVIIETEKIINIQIKLDEFKSIILYEKQGFVGTKYLSLRNDITYSNNEKAQGHTASWFLNNKLNIIVDAPLNSIIKFCIRYK